MLRPPTWDPVSGLAAGFLCFVLRTAAVLAPGFPLALAHPLAAPAPTVVNEPELPPGAPGEPGAALTLTSPREGATIVSRTGEVAGLADAAVGPVVVTVMQGDAVRGRAYLDLRRPGSFEATVRIGPEPAVGRARLVVTADTAAGTVVLASRSFWICATCA